MATEREIELKRCLDEAFKAFEAGQDERARRLCRQALSLDPDSTTAHSLMGLLYEREGRNVEAAAEYEALVDINPSSDAERQTLKRLRGEEQLAPMVHPVSFDTEEDEDDGRRRRLQLAGIGALMVALAVMLTFVYVNGLPGTRKHHKSSAAAVAGDLETAQKAFEESRYADALAASQRVLNAEPENAIARQIYDRSATQLHARNVDPGGGAWPSTGINPGMVPQAAAPPATPQSAPAIAPLVAAPAAAPAAPVQQPIFSAPSLGQSVPPAPLGGYSGRGSATPGPFELAMRNWPDVPPGTQLVGRLETTKFWRPQTNVFTQPGDGGTPPAVLDTGIHPENEDGGRDVPTKAGRPDKRDDDANTRIHITIKRGTPPAPTTGPAVTPEDDAPLVGTVPVDPRVREAQERQRKLRESRQNRNGE